MSPKSAAASRRTRPARSASAAGDGRGWTAAELAERFGPILLGRVVTDPPPGTATERDWEAANRRGDGLYELIDGALIRKAVSDLSSWLGGRLFLLIANYVDAKNLGYTHPADNFFRLPDGLRAPDASFTRLADRPDGLRARGYSDVPPALVVEALSPRNTRREMTLKRRIYFSAGVEIVWEADPLTEEITVWTAPDADRTLTVAAGAALTAAGVLPGFAVPLADVFRRPGGGGAAG